MTAGLTPFDENSALKSNSYVNIQPLNPWSQLLASFSNSASCALKGKDSKGKWLIGKLQLYLLSLEGPKLDSLYE